MKAENRDTPAFSVRLDQFDPTVGFDRGRPRWVEALWYGAKYVFFLSALPWPSNFKAGILRRFGASIGKNVYFRPRINIHFPWKLSIGDHCWIGEECEIHNFVEIVIEDHVAIAHRVFITSGNHDYKDHRLLYRHAPVRIRTGTWIASCSFIGPGVTVGDHNVVAAGSVVTRSTPNWMVVQGNPASPIRPRVIER